MVASEPVKNEPPNPKPIDVQNYQQPAWKALSDFALQSEIEQPAFQHLVSLRTLVVVNDKAVAQSSMIFELGCHWSSKPGVRFQLGLNQ